MPVLVEVAKEYADKGVRYYAIDLREEPEKVRAYLQEAGLSIAVPLDQDGSVAQKYGVRGIPTLVIVDKAGLVQKVHVGFSSGLKEELIRSLDNLLAGKQAEAGGPIQPSPSASSVSPQPTQTIYSENILVITPSNVVSLPVSAFSSGPADASSQQADLSDKPAAQMPTPRMEILSGWGTAIDPAGDCTFEKADGKLTISVPGSEKAHNLSPEKTNTTAPRVVQPIAGDFVIQVRVDGEFQPGAESTEPTRRGYTGAGLVVIADENNLVRLERATLWGGGKPRPYTNFEIRVDGKLERFGNTGDLPTEADKPTWLRLERKGSQMLGAMSQEGEHWTYGTPKELRAEAWSQNNIVAGVAAISNSRDTFAPTYSAFSIQQDAKLAKDTTEPK